MKELMTVQEIATKIVDNSKIAKSITNEIPRYKSEKDRCYHRKQVIKLWKTTIKDIEILIKEMKRLNIPP